MGVAVFKYKYGSNPTPGLTQFQQYNIPGKGYVYTKPDGRIYVFNGYSPQEIRPTAYDLQQLDKQGFSLASRRWGRYTRDYNLVEQDSPQQNSPQEQDSSTNTNPSKPVVTSTNGGGARRKNTLSATPKYNYNFGQYSEDNPNDKEHPITKDYWNADKYSNFRSAFNAAKSGGYGVFTWRGKAYATMDKGDNADEFRRKHSDYDNFIGNTNRGIVDGVDYSGGYSKDSNYKLGQVAPEELTDTKVAPAQTTVQAPAQTPQQKVRLEKFSNDDIRSLGFNNYQGLLNAANNSANSNNNFLKAMYDRYGSDTSKWNQATIEGDLGVKGKYRRFGRGDFGDMARSMMGWVGKNNGEIDKELSDRTGSNDIVYSNKQTRDLFERHAPKNTSTINTSNQYNTQTNFNKNQFTLDNNWLRMGYTGQNTQKYQQGGQINMDEQQLQQAFLQYLMQKTGAQNQQQLEQVIQQMGEQGVQQAYAEFMQAMQQQQVQAAKFGAKLNYIRQLNGQCPKGMEMHYYKQGGRLCKKCMQVKQDGGEMEAPSNPIDAFKCGRKIRKNQQGKKFPLIETDKNGKNKKVYYKDEATRDSIAVNRYNDQETQVNKPGSYKKNAKGQVQWTPDRTKAPYKKR